MDSLGHIVATYWWLCLIVISLILSVRGNLPIWVGIAFALVMLVFFSNNTIAYAVRTAISNVGRAFLNGLR